jgi:uncharacterized protein (UPF0147 family)
MQAVKCANVIATAFFEVVEDYWLPVYKRMKLEIYVIISQIRHKIELKCNT